MEVAHLSAPPDWLALEFFLSSFSFFRVGIGWGNSSVCKVSFMHEDLIYSTYIKVGAETGLDLAAKSICHPCTGPKFISQNP